MLVAMGEKEEVKLPPIPEHEPEGSYRVNSFGLMERMKNTTFEDSEDEWPTKDLP